jgi:hypothetical protein
MSFASIDKPSKYFNTVLYTGNGSTQTVTGLNFAPDWLWIKGRSGARNHSLFDIVRGNDKRLISNSTSAETTETAVTSFNSDGFSLDSGTTANANGETFVSWNFKANGTGVSNTSGTISSTVSANTTSGFSIVSYTGTGASATVGHGLGVVPKMIICKARSIGYSWEIYHASLGNTQYLRFNTSATDTSAQMWNSTTPTSSVFSLGTEDTNTSGQTYIAYCFAEVKGFSKFGSYVANGSSDGSFIYTGFTPAFVMTKQTSGSGGNWFIVDNKRNTFNVVNNLLDANLSSAERNANIYDFYSNGFKDRLGLGSGETFIYMAFASSPFTSSKGIPTTAR